MKELNQEQHIQLLQFMSLMQNCKTEEEMQALKTQYYNIPHYSFLQEYISDKNKEQSLASYKTSLIYDMDKYQQDYKFVYGESFPVFKKESLPNKKADYTVLNLLDEINECNNMEEYQKLLNEYNKFPKAKIENLSSDYTGIFYFSGNKVTGLPSDIIPNSPESNFNARKHLVGAGYSLFNLPSVEDVKDNGFDWLQEEISHFKESLNPNFIEMEEQINTEAVFNESGYEEYFDDFIEQMDANEGMSSMAAEADYNAFQNEQEERRLQEDFNAIGKFENAVGKWSEYSNIINFFDFHNHSDEFLKFMDAAREEKEISGHKDNISFVQHYLENKLEIPIYKNGERISHNWTDEERGRYSSVISRLNFIAQAIVKSNETYTELSSGRQGVIHNTERLELYGAKDITELEKTLQKIKDELNLNNVGQEKNMADSPEELSLFDKELQEFIDGKLPKSHIFTLGKPSEILVKCGFPGDQRIELSASHLEFKSKLDWHPFELKDVMGLEKALKNPIAVFEYGDRKKSQNVIINIEKDGKNFLAGVHFNQEHNGFEISTIRTLFPKDTVEWLNWMNQGKMIYGNKEKLQALIAQQRINVADVNSQVVQSPLYEHCLESSSSILDKFGEVKDIFTDEYPFYKEVKKKAAIEQKFFNYYVTKGNLDSRELSVFEAEEFYNALKSGNTQKIDEYTKTDLHEIKELAAEIYEEFSKEKEVGMTQNLSAVSQSEIDNPSSIIGPPSKVEDFVRNDSSEVDIPVDSKTELQSNKNMSSNYSAPRPQNMKELHEFFINNPYTAGTPVPTLALRNEQTGHSTFIEGYEFARFEDIGKENPAFKDENGNQIKPDGQTVVLTKPGFREEINNETGEKELVPDEDKRKFIRISRDLYEQTLKNSEIIAKRNPKTNEERQKMIDDYLEAANLDEKKQRVNTASNFWHNYQAGVMTLANNKQEAMAFAKRLVNEMIPSERKKFAAMVKNYEKIIDADGKHLSYDKRILERYEDITKGLQITNKSIWRDHVDKKYDTLETIKQNTEVFDIEGQSLDKTCRMKIGDTIKMSVTVDSALSNKKIKLPPQEYKLVAHSKDNNSVALISVDGKQKIIKSRDDFIKEVQKVEKKLIKKQQKQDRYESISM